MIKRLRAAQGLSQRALAARAGVTNPYIAQLETGQRGTPTVLVATRLAATLSNLPPAVRPPIEVSTPIGS